MNKNIYIKIILIFIFWILLFYIQQLVFISISTTYFTDISVNQLIKALKYAFYMNISASSYLMLLPIIFITIALSLKNNKLIVKTTNFIVIFQIIICIIIGIIDAGIFSAWGTKLNAKAISYIFYPSEMIKGMASVSVVTLILLLIVMLSTFLFIYIKILKINTINTTKPYKNILFSLLIFSLLFVGIRGGIQPRPINKGWAFHSTDQDLNYSAVNSLWNFVEILVNQENTKNSYIFFDKSKADSLFAELHNYMSDSCIYILKKERPNIVMILMESVSADNLKTLGAKENIMPGLDSLSKLGVSFSDFYASGFRTEQGLIALLSGFPAQPASTVIRHFNKFENLPHLGRVLSDNSYTNNYYYSGNLSYANTKSYLLAGGFSKIIGEEYKWENKTRWGAYDKELFDLHLKQASNDKQPFFSIIMTSTNHEPFDGKVEKMFTGEGSTSDYKNTSYYTDKCIVEYLKEARNKTWYSNTLFVIVSDHAHSYPKHHAHNVPERHHIPFILFGDVIKPEFEGYVIDKTASQIDFPALILNQLNIDSKYFKWSKNIFSQNCPQFAFYSFDNGFGIITPEKYVIYDHIKKEIIKEISRKHIIYDDNLSDKGKAYLQILTDDFINLSNNTTIARP